MFKELFAAYFIYRGSVTLKNGINWTTVCNTIQGYITNTKSTQTIIHFSSVNFKRINFETQLNQCLPICYGQLKTLTFVAHAPPLKLRWN
jgi:hypothetical protein